MEDFKKLLRQLEFTAHEAVTNFIRSGWMSWIVITTMIVSLSIFGAFLMMVKDLNHLTDVIGSKVQIVIFLKKDANLEKVHVDVSKIEGVVNSEAISKEKGWQELKSELKDSIELENIENQNPLPDTIQVNVNNPKEVDNIAARLKNIPEVDEIKYSKELAEYIDQLSQLVKIVGSVIVTIFGFSMLAIIVNTIRLAVNSRKGEIEIMRLVGATDWFIRMPFLLEGVFFGFFSAIVTSGILYFVRSFSISQIKTFLPFMPLDEQPDSIIQIVLLTMFVSIITGLAGSAFAVARYLSFEKASKDEV